jgi:hypothetical protein
VFKNFLNFFREFPVIDNYFICHSHVRLIHNGLIQRKILLMVCRQDVGKICLQCLFYWKILIFVATAQGCKILFLWFRIFM